MANLRTANSLFLNPNWIQIRTIFMWVPDLLPLLGPLIFLSPFFSLSLTIQTLLSLFLLAITEGKAPPYTAATRRHLAKLIAKKIPNQNLSSSTNKNTTRPKKKRETH
jgi:hypothetical protein